MIQFTINIYRYSTGLSTQIRVGGHISSNLWYNVFAYGKTDSAPNYNVRFGNNGGSDMYVWVGETSSTWEYPQVFITDVQNGFSSITSFWASGWAITTQTSFNTVQIVRAVALSLNINNYTSYSPTLTGTGASGTWGINISGAATDAIRIRYNDGPRNLSDRLPNTLIRTVFWDFVTAGTVGGTGNYAGVMTYAPWDGTTASTGDSSYQLAFMNETSINGSGLPGLRIRKGIDTTWGSWYTLLHAGNYNSYSPTLTGTGASGTWGINVTGTAGSAPNGTNANAFYNVTPGDGYGLKFWSSDSYKISMGVSSVYLYGPVTDYSIKTQMDVGSTGRGFTWGREGVVPIAALNSTSGNMQIAGTFTCTTLTETSTIRVKENIEEIQNPLDIIKKLRGVQYNKIGNNNKEIGVIAEEVDEVLPQIVTRDTDGNPTSVSYGRLTALLIEVVKKQDEQIENLTKRIEELENRL